MRGRRRQEPASDGPSWTPEASGPGRRDAAPAGLVVPLVALTRCPLEGAAAG